ncbi:murein tripeptide amidase MpaA [Amycolatopsis viridis]|uniref:Murein tripeptide amidase MpaA n=1 Tax=Amycolatopsis viridis TaxID=185678 RepID=A0ABX0SL35_9PSEU|nr:murein tripeptide amidase MpaA [Amycolatopsis viridis]
MYPRRAAGIVLALVTGAALLAGPAPARAAPADFPAGDEGYHTYAEVTAELEKAVANHPDLAALSSVGKSYEGRELTAVKISDHVSADEGEPEVLFTCNQHAREHLTTEMCLHIVQRLTSGYATDPNIRSLVDGHVIWVIPNVNPDGSEFDISGGGYQYWRKNRRPVEGSRSVGTDLNRNWGYKWGCCDGSSTSPSSETYRGPSAFSEPETRAVSRFVDSRAPRIKAHIDFHTYAELVLWPFGHTKDDTTEGMTAEENARLRDVGQRMAATNGYTAQQSSDLYLTDGDINDWMWGSHKILTYTFEMYPTGPFPGFYPPDEDIARETTRNDAAVDILIGEAR